MKKFSLLAIILILAVLMSACGFIDCGEENSKEDDTNEPNRTTAAVTQLDDKSEIQNKSEPIEINSEPDTKAALAEAEQCIKKFSSSEFDVEEYDTQYCFVNKAKTEYVFSGAVMIDGTDIELPCTYNYLEEKGFKSAFADDSLGYESTSDFDLPTGDTTLEGSEKRVQLVFYNPGDSEIKMRDGICYGIHFIMDDKITYYVEGITERTTNISEVKSMLGEPTSITYEIKYDELYFTYEIDYMNKLDITTTKNGDIIDIWYFKAE